MENSQMCMLLLFEHSQMCMLWYCYLYSYWELADVYVKTAVSLGMDVILAGGFEQYKLLSIAKIREKDRDVSRRAGLVYQDSRGNDAVRKRWCSRSDQVMLKERSSKRTMLTLKKCSHAQGAIKQADYDLPWKNALRSAGSTTCIREECRHTKTGWESSGFYTRLWPDGLGGKSAQTISAYQEHEQGRPRHIGGITLSES